MRTYKQQLASTLRRNEYKGCTGQVTEYTDRVVIEIFSQSNNGFPYARKTNTGSYLIASIEPS